MSEISEEPEERARKYIVSLSAALHGVVASEQDTSVKVANVLRVMDAIERYLNDAKHYLDNGRATTSLASIAYAEGLLDALTFLGLASNKDM